MKSSNLLTVTDLQEAYHDKEFIDYMLNHIKNLIFVADKNSRFVYINDTVINKYGYSREELLNMSISDIDINYNQEQHLVFWDELSAKKTLQFYSIHKDKNRHLHHVLIQAHYVEYKGEVYNFGVVQDEGYIQNILNAHDGFVILTDGKKLVMSNAATHIFFGYTDFFSFISEHKCICEFFIEEEGFIFNSPSWVNEVKEAQYHDAKVKIKNPTSQESHIFLVRAAPFDEIRFLVTFTDITELENYKNKLELFSITDGLTALYNRRYFNEILPREINRARRDNKQLAYIMLDVDYFKSYNDTYGHMSGDNVLISIAHTIQKNFNRASDFCFRIGGEEFGILFTITSSEEGYKMAEQLRNAIESLHIEHKKSNVSQYVTVSVGIVICKDSSTLESLYSHADSELYNAKESGRNCVFPQILSH